MSFLFRIKRDLDEQMGRGSNKCRIDYRDLQELIDAFEKLDSLFRLHAPPNGRSLEIMLHEAVSALFLNSKKDTGYVLQQVLETLTDLGKDRDREYVRRKRYPPL